MGERSGGMCVRGDGASLDLAVFFQLCDFRIHIIYIGKKKKKRLCSSKRIIKRKKKPLNFICLCVLCHVEKKKKE